ncbi:MAG TPA: hypothetical protein VMU04_23040 [Candidatus Acidoferrum sp.]|nr:hypothetical protein [Candidatus Acidoferrum sp.]
MTKHPKGREPEGGAGRLRSSPVRRFMRAIAAGLRLGGCALALAARPGVAADRDEWHVEYKQKQRVSVTYSYHRFTPSAGVVEYEACAAIAPALDQQRQVSSSFAVDSHAFPVQVVREGSRYHRVVMKATIPCTSPQSRSDITVSATYEVTLYERHLRRGPTLGPAPVLAPDARDLDMLEPKGVISNPPPSLSGCAPTNWYAGRKRARSPSVAGCSILFRSTWSMRRRGTHA